MATNYTPDSFIASVVWGRLGAALLMIIAFGLSVFGYTLSTDDQAALNGIITAGIAGVATIINIVSKMRETKKVAAG